MNAEIFAALAQLEKERGIPQSYMIDKITQALVAAYKKDKDGYTDNVFVEIQDNDMKMYVQKEVVDDVLTPATEISLDAAQKIDKHAQLGDLVNVDVKTQAFGRIAAQTAKQVIIQGIREAERGMVFDTFSSKEHEILTGTVLRVEPMSGDMIVRIGGGNRPHRRDARGLRAGPRRALQGGRHDPRLRGRGAQKHPRPAGHRLPHASGPRQAPL
jgi:N utilization substance protein A